MSDTASQDRDRDDELVAPFQRHPAAREVYRDAGLWALNKPAGVLSHPNPPGRRASNAILRVDYDLKREVYVASPPGGRPREAELLHRLDQDTSGLILLALDAELAARMKELFYHREISKEYRVVVRGVPREPTGTWTDQLRKTRRGRQLRVEVVRGGKRPDAQTRYRLLEVVGGGELSLLSLQPQTGRTHQLRVQCAARGLPIAGDARYGDFAWNRALRSSLGLKRMWLHALRMVFRHPESGRRVKLVADEGPALRRVLEQLRS